MGSRANYVIIRNGKVSAFYEHWGADGVLDAMIDGPDECERAARGCSQVDELMDRAYCEGGYLLDFDRKMALFFGYASDAFQREIEEFERPPGAPDESPWIGAARSQWPGWKLSIADRGVDDFSGHLATFHLTGQVKTMPPAPPRSFPSPPALTAPPPRRHGKQKRKR